MSDYTVKFKATIFIGVWARHEACAKKYAKETLQELFSGEDAEIAEIELDEIDDGEIVREEYEKGCPDI